VTEGRVLIDTNQQAIATLRTPEELGVGAITIEVLSEFFSVATVGLRRLRSGPFSR
jgi:hypothetical protein